MKKQIRNEKDLANVAKLSPFNRFEAQLYT